MAALRALERAAVISRRSASTLALHPSANGSCPICQVGDLKPDVGTSRFAVRRCTRCRHRVATHAPAKIDRDYHEQYEQGAFLESLAATRTHQADTILDLIRRLLPSGDDLLDYGAGRGWFLEACRRAGMSQVAGADTSRDAMASLEARGVPAVVVPMSADASFGLDRLPFRPRILTLLDVVEHFPPEQVCAFLGRLLREIGPQLQLVVIKVPVADGFLYSVSRALASGLIRGPIEQLYQVGTFPPHFNYFTRASMRRLIDLHAMKILAEVGICEIGPETAQNRVASLRRLPRPVARAAGATLSLLAGLASKDSVIFIAAPAA
jgi:hypothetical protein